MWTLEVGGTEYSVPHRYPSEFLPEVVTTQANIYSISINQRTPNNMQSLGNLPCVITASTAKVEFEGHLMQLHFLKCYCYEDRNSVN
uniref:Uncharacterized protein n=2 Tax=Anguilla anguilla TaxID=7936 RepID=A0A0E9Q902_ANGAN